MESNVGRGAPEIDILEAMPGYVRGRWLLGLGLGRELTEP